MSRHYGGNDHRGRPSLSSGVELNNLLISNFQSLFITGNMKRGSVCLAIMLTILVFLPGCGQQAGVDTTVARVGNETLTVEELVFFINPENNPDLTSQARREFVQQWIDTEILYREALRKKLHKNPQIKQAIQQMEKELLAAELMELQLGGEMVISDYEAEEYYRNHQDEFFLTETHIRARHILVNTREEARRVRNRLRNSEPFDSLVVEVSVDTSTHDTGGDLGVFAREDVPQDIANAAFRLDIEEISGPVETQWGFHIIQVTDIKPAGSLIPFDEAKDEVVNTIYTSRQRLAFDELMKELKKNEDIEIHWDLLLAE